MVTSWYEQGQEHFVVYYQPESCYIVEGALFLQLVQQAKRIVLDFVCSLVVLHHQKFK